MQTLSRDDIVSLIKEKYPDHKYVLIEITDDDFDCYVTNDKKSMFEEIRVIISNYDGEEEVFSNTLETEKNFQSYIISARSEYPPHPSSTYLYFYTTDLTGLTECIQNVVSEINSRDE